VQTFRFGAKAGEQPHAATSTTVLTPPARSRKEDSMLHGRHLPQGRCRSTPSRAAAPAFQILARATMDSTAPPPTTVERRPGRAGEEDGREGAAKQRPVEASPPHGRLPLCSLAGSSARRSLPSPSPVLRAFTDGNLRGR
jgi:hypothetical protein